MKPTDIIQIIRYFGIFPVTQGAWHKLIKKLGVFRYRFPTTKWNDLSLSSFLIPGTSKNHLKKALAETGFFPIRHLIKNREILAETNSGTAETIQRAENITKGRFRYFSKIDVQLAEPINWHCNPFAQVEWPKDKHWFDIDYFVDDLGDIKLVWELNRFSWVFELVRAYGLTGNVKYAEVFWGLFEHWLQENQPNTGANWASGQECALRVMACCFGLFAFLDEPATTQQRLEKLFVALSVHAERIENFISHAVRQKTNHAMTEAGGLYTVGVLFPFFRNASRWKSLGKKILEREGLRQIYNDGTYIQHSMNYHRLMLHAYLWCLRLAELNDDSFSDQLRSRLSKATEFLYQTQDDSTGRMPNYGSNDGALILPLNSCDYLDYRPIAQAMNYLLHGKMIYDAGPWDEDILWLFGPDVLDAPKTNVPRVSSQFREGGYYTLRSTNSWAMMRCHSYRDRPCHVDMLHFDLWADGINLLRDCGSYKYFAPDEPDMENYFKSIHAHNTVIIDGSSPLYLAGRFIWLPWPKAEVLKFEKKTDRIQWEGLNLAYNRSSWNIVHSRHLAADVDKQRWEITDKLTGRGRHRLELRWHLPTESEIISSDASLVRIRLVGGWFLDVVAEHIIEAKLLKSNPTGGWESLYYACRKPICTLSITNECKLPSMFRTTLWKEAK